MAPLTLHTFACEGTLWYMVTGIFIAAGEYSLALVQHRVLVRAPGWIRPWPGITCTPTICNVLYCSVLWCIVLCSGITCIQTTIHPDPLPIHRPAMDPEYVVCWPTPVCWLFDTFSFSKLLECRFRLSLGVRMRGLFPFWNKWSVVSEWACEPGWQATHFSGDTWCRCNVTKQKLDQN